MKAQLILCFLFIFFLSSQVFSHENYLGHAPDRGVLISVTPDKLSAKSGEKVIFQGTISVVNKSDDEHKYKTNKMTLLEEFKKQGLDLVATFPSDAIDVSSQLKYSSSGRDSIVFTYETSVLTAVELNQFSLKLFNNHQERETLKKLAQIQAKLERRILALQMLIQNHQKLKSSKENLDILQKSIDSLKSISLKITGKLNSSEDLIAENTYALQLDNITSSSSKISTVMNKFRFVIESQVGSVIEGLGTKIKASVSNLRSKEDDKEEDFYHKSDKRIVEYMFNNAVLQIQNLNSLSAGQIASFEFQADSLKPTLNNLYTVSVYKSEKNKKSKRVGSLFHKIPVIDDLLSPEWDRTNSKPSKDLQYVNSMQAVDLFVNDSFGRINASTLSATLSGTTLQQVSYFKDLTSIITKTPLSDGSGYEFQAPSQDLEEGDYTFKASVKDFALNVANPEPYSVTFKIDKMSPVIGVGIEEGKLTNLKYIDFPVIIKDQSPAWTELYSNDVLIYTTRATDFTASLPLEKEGQNILKIISIDEAGNASLPTIVHIIRDTTPPVLSFVSPKAGEAVDGYYFQIQVTSNEKIKSATINDQLLQLENPVLDFKLDYSTVNDGELLLRASATDLAGNQADVSAQIYTISRALNQSLIGLYVDEKENKVYVKGAVGATRPNYVVKISTGFFSSESVTANSDGSFLQAMEPSQKYKVSVYDERKEETVSFEYILDGDNEILLSGIVRDSEDHPLVNAKVLVSGTELVTFTDSQGVFKFLKSSSGSTIISGDRQIIVDGSTVIIPQDGVKRRFSKTSIAVTIGIRQSNVLQTPIYLSPVFLDGSATLISQQVGGTVNDVHAPGVELNIPANAVQFPDSSLQSYISIQEIQAERATVAAPIEARPSKVIALEPSGTTFSKPVDITLPNVNNFPPKTDMVIMLMNSKTGKWEIGGAASVSEDGSNVVTKPNMGIKHFSLAYATIAGPNIRQIGAQDKPGADSMNGALSRSVTLPSFKTYGQEFTPGLVYKSTWAKPNVVVTNLLDFPEKKIDVTLDSVTGSGVQKYTAKLKNCSVFLLVPFCSTKEEDFYTNFEYKVDYSNVTSQIQPEKVIAKLNTGSIETNSYEYKNIPRMANISFAVDLYDSIKEKYFESGIYPYVAHYDIYFKELIMGTATTTYWTDTMNAQTKPPESFSKTNENQLFTKDLANNILVQNYQDSPAGKGWRVSGVQKIVNPGSNQLLVEEADGSLVTYGLKNTIETVLDLSSSSTDISRGVALNNWPQVFMAAKTTDDIYSQNVQSASASSKFSTNYLVQGKLKGYDFYNYNTQTCTTNRICSNRVSFPGGNVCIEWKNVTTCVNNPKSYCGREDFNFKITSKPSQMIFVGDKIYGVDSTRHSLFVMDSAQSTRLLGATDVAKTYGNYYAKTESVRVQNVNADCASTDGMNCTSLGAQVSNLTGSNACGIAPTTTDMIPVKGSGVINGHQALNTPLGLALKPNSSIIAIADSGNHLVRYYNLQDGTTGVIAGNGTVGDNGDNGYAIDAQLNHPQGVAYDNLGNLYISTQSGYVRKVDSNGIISTIAGNPINGILTLEGNPLDIKLTNPYGLVVDNERQYIYVADNGRNNIIRIDLNTNLASVIAGNGDKSSYGDGGLATSAALNSPTHLYLDEKGNLIIADSGNNKIRRVNFDSATFGILTYQSSSLDNSKLVKDTDGKYVRTFRSGDQSFFDFEGKQFAFKNRLGQETMYFYDSNRNLTDITLPNGQTIVYTYSSGQLSKITDPAGRITEFSYNSSRHLKSVQFPDGSQVNYNYDSDGRMISETDKSGNTVQYVYNDQGRVEKIISPDQSAVKIVDADSKILTDTKNDQVNTPTNSGVNEGQNFSSITDANGNTIDVSKNYQGYISTIKDPKGNKTIIERDNLGRPVKITSADGGVVENIYDSIYGDLVSVKDLNLNIQEAKTYNQWGQILTQVDGEGRTYSKVYDNLKGYLVREQLPNGNEVAYDYYSNGLLKSKSVAYSGKILTWQYVYDTLGNLSSSVNPDGTKSEFISDNSGNVIKKINYVDSQVRSVIEYSYDLWNRLKSVKSANGDITSYDYNQNGDLVKITDPKNKITQYEYDQNGRLQRKTDSFGSVSEFTYDKNGNMITEKDPMGQVKTYSYDVLNQMIQAQLPDDLIKYEYDIRGKIVKASNMVSQVDYELDTKSRVTSVQVTGLGELSNYPQVTMNMVYDKNGNRTKLQTPLGSIGYTYDNVNRLTQLQNSWGDSFSFSYDTVNRLTAMTRSFGFSKYLYLDSGVISGIAHNINGNVIGNSYAYDQRLLPIQKQTNFGVHNYSYDLSGQLTGVTGSENESFTYDGLGNRITDQNGNYVYDPSGQRLTEDYQYIYNYDLNGNLIQKFPKDQSQEAYTYSYSSKNQLMSVNVLENALGEVKRRVSFKYDVLGRRIQKESWDRDNVQDPTKTYIKKYVYDGDNVLFEYDGSNNLLAKYTHSPLKADDVLTVDVQSAGVTAGLAQTQGKYQYLKDAIGSVTEVVNNSGTIVQRYEYSSFGKLKSIKDLAGNDISSNPVVRTSYTYTGREYDTETGLYYYRARYYDPSIGRFLQQDPDPGKMRDPSTYLSKYVYVGNMPMIVTDPSGKFWWFVAFALVGAANGFIAGEAAGLSGFALFEATLLGAATSVIAPWAGAAYGIGVGLAASFLSGAVYQAGMQQLAFGKIVNQSYVWASGSAAFVGGAFGFAAASNAYNLGFSIHASTLIDNTIGLGLGAIGGGISVGTPTKSDVDNYKYRATMRGYVE